MINPFKNLSDLKAMRDQAMQIQQALAQEVITVEKNGVKVVITGDQKVQSLEIDGATDNRILEAVNEAIKKSQEVAAKKLQEMSGGLGGLLGK
ncbi:YbaB/EbfC family nucleoid-associated protein [Candidatus Gottesmanbacteria bacterium]|nr:YbaB/EbfC family nucleoid-associated protein [Candidatus Gottesmanbacteria bacterium]MBI5465027.1 YbaB/EbfC family nucleoid-associated protein [Candidatus Gottesmanbacteria bacterium]